MWLRATNTRARCLRRVARSAKIDGVDLIYRVTDRPSLRPNRSGVLKSCARRPVRRSLKGGKHGVVRGGEGRSAGSTSASRRDRKARQGKSRHGRKVPDWRRAEERGLWAHVGRWITLISSAGSGPCGRGLLWRSGRPPRVRAEVRLVPRRRYDPQPNTMGRDVSYISWAGVALGEWTSPDATLSHDVLPITALAL